MMDATLVKHTFGEDLYQLPSRVLVVIPSPWEMVTDAEQLLLARILGSVKLSLAAVQITHATTFSLEDALVFQARTILSFGVDLAGVSQRYEAVSFGDASVIVADAMGELDDTRKKNLWTALKQIFKA
jgi:hypothetical protein